MFFLTLAFGSVHVALCNDKYTLCNTAVCRKIGNLLLDSIDESVTPCDDIYQYVCGKWLKNHPIGDSSPNGLSIEPNMRHIQKRRLLGILNEESKPTDSIGIKFARQLYKKCLDSATRKTDGLTSLNKHIKQIGGWPLLDAKRNLDDTKWQDIYKKIYFYFSSPSLYDILIQETNVTFDLLLRRPTTFLPYKREATGEINPGDAKLTLYRKFIDNVSRELAKSRRVRIDEEKLSSEIGDIINFELTILQAYNVKNNILGKTFTIDEYQKVYNDDVGAEGNGAINWLEMIQNVFLRTEMNIQPDTEMYVVELNYFIRLGDLLERTPTRTIVNYIIWHFIRHLLPYTTERMQKFVQEAEGTESTVTNKNRQWVCFETPNLKLVMEYEYVMRYFNKDNKKKVLQILRDVTTATHENVKRATWMDSAMKTNFNRKVDSKVLEVGYPHWYSDASIEHCYENVNNSALTLTFLDSILTVFQCNALAQIKRFTEQNPLEWYFIDLQHKHSIDFTANSASKGPYRIPAAVFHDALYHPDKPEAMNYGSVGYQLGYQLATGYGTFYDLIKEERNVTTTLPPPEKYAYKRMKTCFKTYYNEHVKKGAKSRHIQTDQFVSFERFVTDTAVISSVWRSWQEHKSLVQNFKDLRLPKITHHNSDQLFFISIVHNYCESRQSAARHIRLWSSFSSLPAFGEIFRCPKGSPMNPVKKCAVWS